MTKTFAVETSYISICFHREGLRQLQCSKMTNDDEDLHGRNVLHFNMFPLLRDCSTITQSYLCHSNEPLPNYRSLAMYILMHMALQCCCSVYSVSALYVSCLCSILISVIFQCCFILHCSGGNQYKKS